MFWCNARRSSQWPYTGTHSAACRPATDTDAAATARPQAGAVTTTPLTPAPYTAGTTMSRATASATRRGPESPRSTPRVDRRPKRTVPGVVAEPVVLVLAGAMVIQAPLGSTAQAWVSTHGCPVGTRSVLTMRGTGQGSAGYPIGSLRTPLRRLQLPRPPRRSLSYPTH